MSIITLREDWYGICGFVESNLWPSHLQDGYEGSPNQSTIGMIPMVKDLYSTEGQFIAYVCVCVCVPSVGLEDVIDHF